jgi:hypothetical protein
VVGRLEGPADHGADTQDIEERLTDFRASTRSGIAVLPATSTAVGRQ